MTTTLRATLAMIALLPLAGCSGVPEPSASTQPRTGIRTANPEPNDTVASGLASTDKGRPLRPDHPSVEVYEKFIKSICGKASDRPSDEEVAVAVAAIQRLLVSKGKSEPLLYVAEGIDATLSDGSTDMTLKGAAAFYGAYRATVDGQTRADRLRLLRALPGAVRASERMK